MANGRLSKDSRNEIRKTIIELLKDVPEGEKIKLDIKLLDDLIFFKYYDQEFQKQIKIPIWTGVFLRKLDLSELSFENANLDVSEYDKDNKEYFQEGAISHLDKKSINKYIKEYMECNDKELIEGKYTLDFSYTNIKKRFEDLDINCISNCNFEGVDLSDIGKTNVAFYDCNLQRTNIKIPQNANVLFNCDLRNNDLSNTTLDARNIMNEDEEIYCCNLKNTGLNIIYKFDLDENSKKSYEEIEKIKEPEGEERRNKIRKLREMYGREDYHENEIYYAETLKELIEKGYLDGCYLNGKLIDSRKYEKDLIKEITTSIQKQKKYFKK